MKGTIPQEDCADRIGERSGGECPSAGRKRESCSGILLSRSEQTTDPLRLAVVRSRDELSVNLNLVAGSTGGNTNISFYRLNS